MKRAVVLVGLLAIVGLVLALALRSGSEGDVPPPSAGTPTAAPRASAPPVERARRRAAPTPAAPVEEPAPLVNEGDPTEEASPAVVVHVVDEHGEPVEDALVSIAPQNRDFDVTLASGPPVLIELPCVADAAGLARFPGHYGAYDVPTVFQGVHGQLTGWVRFDPVPDEREQTVRLVLRPGVFLRGRVELPDGLPARDAQVTLGIPEGTAAVVTGCAESESRATTTDERGQFEFGPLLPPPWPEPMALEAVLGADSAGATVFDERPVVLRLIETKYVRGRVMDADGTPSSAVGSVLHLHPAGETTTLATARVREDGSFALPCRPGHSGQPHRFDVELVARWIEVHEHEPLLAGFARGVTVEDDAIVAAARAPFARVFASVAPSVDASAAYGGEMSIVARDGTTVERQRTTLRGGGASLRITRPVGVQRLVLDFGAAGRWEGPIEIPLAGEIMHEVALVPPR